MEGREAKDQLYEVFARTAKALANPKRIELLELAAQGERTVEAFADATGMSVTNTSAHLQVLARSGMVAARRDGTRVFYRVAADEVTAFVGALRDLARTQAAEVDRVVRDYFTARDALEPVGRDQLRGRAASGEVVVVDVRPFQEYLAGHIPGALSIPLDALEDALDRLPRDIEIVAYCRGPYCVFAVQAVARLRASGFRARRLEDGLPEWRLAGLPVVEGAA